jgi:phosphoglycolate phosphatase
MTVVLLWDIDGTLLSTARAGVIALERAALEVAGRPIDLTRMRTAGLTDGQIGRRILDELGAEADVEAFLAAYERELPAVLGLRAGRVLPGVREVLEDLSGDAAVLSLLLTGNTEAGAAAKLAHYGLAGFFGRGGAFCVDGGERAEIAARAVARAGTAFAPDRAFVIGDTKHDVACALAVGVRCLAVATGGASVPELWAAGAWRVVEELPPPAEFRALVGLPRRTRRFAPRRTAGAPHRAA